jgi:hypothetical protein
MYSRPLWAMTALPVCHDLFAVGLQVGIVATKDKGFSSTLTPDEFEPDLAG